MFHILFKKLYANVTNVTIILQVRKLSSILNAELYVFLIECYYLINREQ